MWPAWADECAALQVAHADDEEAVLREFAAGNPSVACEHMTAAETLRRFPAVNPDGLRGALHR